MNIEYTKELATTFELQNKFFDNLRSKVFAAETLMKQIPQLELHHRDYFSHGVYARELHIPKDTIIVGKLHKYPQMNILTKGSLSVLVDEEIKFLSAPFVVCSPAGTKRIAYAHEDTIWITVHGTELTDVDAIEEHFIAQTEEDYIKFCKQQEQFKLPFGWDNLR